MPSESSVSGAANAGCGCLTIDGGGAIDVNAPV